MPERLQHRAEKPGALTGTPALAAAWQGRSVKRAWRLSGTASGADGARRGPLAGGVRLRPWHREPGGALGPLRQGRLLMRAASPLRGELLSHLLAGARRRLVRHRRIKSRFAL